MRLSKPIFGVAAVVLAGVHLCAPSQAGELRLAQGYPYPPADLDQGRGDASSLLVRVDRLESQLRKLNGQIEQLQFQNRKLEEQLRKFQEDVDFRFQDFGRAGAPAPAAKPQKHGDAIEGLIADDKMAMAGTPSSPESGRSAERGDAFDPASDPDAPGAPRPLGSPDSAAPPPRADSSATEGFPPDGPLDLAGSRWRAQERAGSAAKPDQGGAAQGGMAALTTPGAASAPATNPVKEEFDLAFGYYRQKQYELAEKSLSTFIQKNPKSRYAADATFYLGESFLQRNRPSDAAREYLKFSTLYVNSARAPEAMLRLGQSLNALGAKEQACAAFSEIGRKYPNASGSVKAGAEREMKRIQC